MKKAARKPKARRETASVHPLVLRCVQLHEALMRNGFVATGQMMHAVVQSVGYELADKLARKRGKGGA
jgi:hypothetical protein